MQYDENIRVPFSPIIKFKIPEIYQIHINLPKKKSKNHPYLPKNSRLILSTRHWSNIRNASDE